MLGVRVIRNIASPIEGELCHCRRSVFANGRRVSKWSLGTNRKGEKPKVEVISKPKLPVPELKPKDAKVLARERMFKEEERKYELGRRWLAAMMGEDSETFDKEKIREALDYLLPSHLFATDARPMLKGPVEAYGQKKDIVLDDDDRPLDPGFYTRQPRFHRTLYEIYKKRQELSEAMKDSSNLRSVEDSSGGIKRWMKREEVENYLQEKIKDDQYDLLISRLKKLESHPCCHLASELFSSFQVVLVKETRERILLEIEEDGTVTAMGHRKQAVAEVKVKRGTGRFLVNGEEMHDYFRKIPDRQQLMHPYLVIDGFEKFDVDASVIAGGISGQAGAIRLGLSRALPSFDESYYEPLEEAGLLMHDVRRHERKKPGQKGARKKFAWVKR